MYHDQFSENRRHRFNRTPLEHMMKSRRMKSGISRLYELQPDPYDCSQKQCLRLCLFRNVRNSIELRSMLRKGELDVAMIRAEMIVEPFVLLAAANRAIYQAAHNRMCTRSLAAELIYSLSPTRNISESLVKFGIAENSRDLLVATFDDVKGKEMLRIAKKIDGTPTSLDGLRDVADLNLIKKEYQVTEPQLNSATLSDLIVTKIICKDLVL